MEGSPAQQYQSPLTPGRLMKEMEQMIDKLSTEYPQKAAQIRKGTHQNAVDYFMGPLMRASKGTIPPAELKEMISAYIKSC